MSCLEALYGGAAGGGKSDAMLMDAAQFVGDGNYSALMLRKTYADLSLPGALMDRARDWWHDKAKWDDKKKTFTWPSGATITFGYLETEEDKRRYQGAEFQRIYFDELTQFTESQYTYLFSRLRRLAGSSVPIAMRSASNPGGTGHGWVRKRFLSPEAIRDMKAGRYGQLYDNAGRSFVPSKVRDNPHLDVAQYEDALNRLDPVTRAQLKQGDWTASAEGRFKPEWFPRYRRNHEIYQFLRSNGDVFRTIDARDCLRFFTLDPTGTGREMTQEQRGTKPQSWAVCSVWDQTPDRTWLVWRNMLRGQWDTMELAARVTQLAREEQPSAIIVEIDGIGKAVYDNLTARGLPTHPVSTGQRDKLTRAQTACVEAEQGRIWLPESEPWLDSLEAELFTWQGLEGEQADQIDTLSYAAIAKTQGITGEPVWEGAWVR